MHWWAQNNQRFAADLTIGVDADAFNGMFGVDIFVESLIANHISTPAILADQNINLGARKRFGYWFTLSIAKFLAAHGSGNAINIYASGVANDGTMQTRVIGPLTLYPEATANDWSKTVGSSGADYTTLVAAITAANAAAAEAPLITAITTGNYEATDGAFTARSTAKGYLTIAEAPGVTMTINRASFPASAAVQNWDPRWYGIEFRGVKVDMRNIGGIVCGSRETWMNGSLVTSSTGTRDTLDWAKGLRPSGVSGNTYWDDCTIEYMSRPCTSSLRVSNCNLHDCFDDFFTATYHVVGNYCNSMDASWLRTPIDALSVTYTGASAAATIRKTQVGDNPAGFLVFAENGVGLGMDIQLGSWPTDTYFDPQAVANYINGPLATAHPGWSATVLDNTRHAAIWGPVSTTSVKNTTVTFSGFFDIHADLWQAFNGGVTRENIIIFNNIVIGIGPNSTQSLFIDDAGVRDLIYKNNVCGAIMPQFAANSTHVVVSHNTCGSVILLNNGTEVADPYSIYSNNVFLAGVFKLVSGNAWNSVAVFVNNAYGIGSHGSPSGANYVGNFSMAGNVNTGGVIAANITNDSIGDERPLAASPMATTLKTPAVLYDGRLNQRAATDAVGAWANGYAAPAYPF